MRILFFALILLLGAVFGISSCSSPSLLGASRLRCSLDEVTRLEVLAASNESRPETQPKAPLTADAPPGAALRVAVFNMRSGFGPSNDRDLTSVTRRLHRIAQAVVEQGAPDVVGLNEVDFNSRRSGFVDQAAVIAEQLRRAGWEYHVVRGSTWRRDQEGREVDFGNALLVRHPVVRANRCLFSDLSACGDSVRQGRDIPKASLPQPWAWLSHEPRGVIAVDFAWRGETQVRAILTHLDPYSAQAREIQAAQIIARLVPAEGPVVLMGDMNTVPVHLTVNRRWFGADRAHDVLTAGRLYDVRAEAAAGEVGGWQKFATYPSQDPHWPLDAVLASAELISTNVEVMGAGLSDHLGLVSTLTVASAERGAARREQLALRQRNHLKRIQRCDAPTGTGASLLGWLGRAAQATPTPIEYSLVR